MRIGTLLDTPLPQAYTTLSMPERTSAEGRPKWMWWGIATAVLLAGFVDLWRGGETIAPILLVAAYCVLVPLAILK